MNAIIIENTNFNDGDNKKMNNSIECECKKMLKIPPKDIRIKTNDVWASTRTFFDTYHLNRDLLKAIFKKGWDTPSPIQEQGIHAVMRGNDILARARNGSGVYALPLLHKINPDLQVVQGLVLVPTRELAIQTSQMCIDILNVSDVEVLYNKMFFLSPRVNSTMDQ